MKKIIFLFGLILNSLSFAHPYFVDLNKCFSNDSKFWCSQRGYKPKGFVYEKNTKKMYELDYSRWGVYSLTTYYCSSISHVNDNGTPTVICHDDQWIETIDCPESQSVTREYEDKYGFRKSQKLKGKSSKYCENIFNKKIP